MPRASVWRLTPATRRSARRSSEAQLGEGPYTLVVGDKEVETGEVAVRNRKGEQEVMFLRGLPGQAEGRGRQQGAQLIPSLWKPF